VTHDEAEKLNTLFLQMVARLDESAAFVRDKDDEANWRLYRRALGKAMAEVFELAEMIWARFPNLKPVQVGGTYVVDTQIYEPAFYEWVETHAENAAGGGEGL
jgi:hypothetical protein